VVRIVRVQFPSPAPTKEAGFQLASFVFYKNQEIELRRISKEADLSVCFFLISYF
jgi:hypothetical protein